MAAINISTPYSQNFDSLPSSGTSTWANDSTISGWYSNQATLSSGSGTSNAGALYSFGANASTDRALGDVTSGATGPVYWGVQLTNNTTSTITGLNIGYTGEQWRDSGAAASQTVDFQYQIGATGLATGTWTTFSPLSFTSPTFSGTAGALDGNAAANRTVLSNTLSGISVTPGQEIWLRWSDVDHPLADHGLAIDNFSVSIASQSVPEPSDLMGTVVAICAATILKRKLSRQADKL